MKLEYSVLDNEKQAFLILLCHIHSKAVMERRVCEAFAR